MRTLIYAALAALIVAGTFSHPLDIAFDAVGVLAGAAVAFLAIRTSTFTQVQDAWRYRPHPWIGIGLFVFFLARVAFDVIVHPMPAPTVHSATASASFASLTADPVSAALLLVIVGYYLVYNIFLLRRARSLGV